MDCPLSKDFAPLPLTLGQVMEGRPIAAQNSYLLHLPDEILSVVMTYINTDREALASLALVNSDCRQLARSCQFCSVVIDYSPRSSCVLGILIREATERLISKNRLTHQPSLGACVRRIQTDSGHYWKEIRAMQPKASRDDEANNVRNDGLGGTFSIDQWGLAVGNMTTRMRHVYDPSLILVISSLPHFGVLDWSNGTTVDNHLLNSLATSTVKHLKLRGSIESEYVTVQIDGEAEWPLLSADIDIVWDFNFHYGLDSADSSSLWDSFFRTCSSSLQSLKFSHRSFLQSQDKPISFTAEFTCLRFLWLGDSTELSEPTLRSLLRSHRLHTLAVDFSYPVTRECLDHVGCLKSLQTLIWTGFDIPETASLQALEQNTQLTAFGIYYSCSASLIERVIPVLATFLNLKTLSLMWDGNTVPVSSLAALSSLVSLEQLHISSGQQAGWRHDWLIDHDAIRTTLFPLRKLKRLAITRDSYRVNNGATGEDIDAYYSFRILDQDELMQQFPDENLGDDSPLNHTHALWETLHRRSMAGHAEKYAVVFEALEWIHVGQLSFVFQNGANRKKAAVSLSRERVENFEALKNMFGIL
ncbi:hypothetical protein P152DRAFT_111348 [Eremomyces bilateralis CBS 781.70]|uniref:F-box domain-containing protein n=1 Tax=Eremomyces bilateralis CBS 781.70 TaxID=1392243 RepID=A0A6G1GDZ0_9PEZI|nr:uncharacterized protein P152DRAFT_111348 [Eremomyces bilateralis CBS 781.70]KAF1816126.1 hypothetical protein P152DRAFT_111348 [Eremomyces bilateralis CBS 781.70]